MSIDADLSWNELMIHAMGHVFRALFSFALHAFGIFPAAAGAVRTKSCAHHLSLRAHGQKVVGSEVRIPMSRDGHFWAKVGVNGAEPRMFVDSDANLKVAIAPGHGDIDVLGMTFLSELQSWRVEGRTLILVPKTPEMN